jgi:hypothetical protein
LCETCRLRRCRCLGRRQWLTRSFSTCTCRKYLVPNEVVEVEQWVSVYMWT